MLRPNARLEKHRRLLSQYIGNDEIDREFMGLHRFMAATEHGLWVVGIGAAATGDISGRMVKCYPWAQIASIELRMGSMQTYIEITTAGQEPRRPGGANHLAENVVLVGTERRGRQRAGAYTTALD